MDTTTEIVLDGLTFPECPRWREGRLWFSDVHAHRIIALAPDGKAETIAETGLQNAGLGWRPDGTLLVVSMVERRLTKLAGSTLETVADLSGFEDVQLNDMCVDRARPRVHRWLRVRYQPGSRGEAGSTALRRHRRAGQRGRGSAHVPEWHRHYGRWQDADRGRDGGAASHGVRRRAGRGAFGPARVCVARRLPGRHLSRCGGRGVGRVAGDGRVRARARGR